MVNEQGIVALTSPTDGLWVGRRGLVFCQVELTNGFYEAKIRTMAGEMVLCRCKCSDQKCLRDHLLQFGFTITLEVANDSFDYGKSYSPDWR